MSAAARRKLSRLLKQRWAQAPRLSVNKGTRCSGICWRNRPFNKNL